MPPAAPDDAFRQRRELAGWFVRRQAPQWSAADEAAFQRWLAADPGNRDTYRRWEADWALIDAMPPASAERLRAMVAADRAIQDAVDRVREPARGDAQTMEAAQETLPEPVATSHRARGASPGRRRMLASTLAAAGVAGIAIPAGWLGWRHLQSRPVYQQAFSTPRGRWMRADLPDGSRLHLDTATALQATFFRGRRELRLSAGQAAFSVSADARRPFVVAAGPLRVTVVGTRFSVRLTPEVPGREGVEVMVEAGRVQIEQAAGPGERTAATWQAFELVAGQGATFDPRGEQPVLGRVPAEGILPPTDPVRSFSDVPLAQAVAEMQRYADLGIVELAPPVARLRLSGTFDLRDPASTRWLLANALPLRVERHANGYALQPGP